MASVYYLLDDALHVPDYIVEKYLHQDKDVKSNYLAAVIVQRSYRGYVARRHYKNIRSAIIKIQKYIRGWLVRYKLPDILQERYDHMCLEHYNKMATKIQACWRGILVRHEMDIKNIINKRELTIDKRKSIKEEYSADTEDNSTNANQDKTNAILNGYSGMPLTNDFYKMKIVDILFDRHHLLSTKKIKGILDNKELTEIEKIISRFSWKDYIKKQKKIYNKFYKMDKYRRYIYRFDEPSLMCQEDLLRLRDKRNDTVEITNCSMPMKTKEFILTSKVEQKPYERHLLKQGKYEIQNKNITRDEDKSRNICESDFKLVLKHVIERSNVAPYYADFWYKECFAHNLTEI
ncbi:uncharacterized protein LOC143198723 isoform X1 [Rhynchophorus ferrugineus]|uniref:Uncharacterized protein n=1 Tax=Rhynchophorus ferrugineus TaxID=354439 RepID=A0A834IKA6_RHYFE|nr:hypothetical protein GWI33_002582 [Rhynchophorus ferrugineus]